ncbi:MAG: histidine phosphatase family protein [Acidobacteria bacterium]|nr:histidine phosphatase family protein [Acidobacteriota bacterium]
MLIVARHGRTESNALGLLLGHADPPLDALGRVQAQAIGAAVGRVDRVISSPLVRARLTAEMAAGGAENIEIDERLIELDYGEIDQKPMAELDAGFWVQWRANIDFAPPGGESLSSLGKRVRSFFDDLSRETSPSDDVLVVTHVSPIKAVMAWTLGVGDEVGWRCFVQPAALMRIALDGSQPSLRSFNETAHLMDIEEPTAGN